MFKRYFIYTFLIFLLLTSYSTPLYASLFSVLNSSDSNQSLVIQPSITINGKAISFPVAQPTLLGGKMYVPVDLFEHTEIQADIFEFIDTDYTKAIISHFNETISIYTNRDHYMLLKVDDMELSTWIALKSSSPYLFEDTLMVPLRIIAEQIGISVGWDVATRTAILTTDDDFRAELELTEEWEEWLGNKPIKFNNPLGQVITEDELSNYVKSVGVSIIDSLIVHKYTALLLYVDEEDGDESLVLRYVDRLRNGKLDWNAGLSIGDSEEDVYMQRNGNLVTVGMFKQGLDKEFTQFKVTYILNDDRVDETHDILGKQGMFFYIPEEVTYGEVTFYGKNGYIFETYFW